MIGFDLHACELARRELIGRHYTIKTKRGVHRAAFLENWTMRSTWPLANRWTVLNQQGRPQLLITDRSARVMALFDRKSAGLWQMVWPAGTNVEIIAL